MAEPKRPCRHAFKTDAWIMFMIGTGNEDDAYNSGYNRATYYAAQIARRALAAHPSQPKES